MPAVFTCAACQNRLRLADHLAGKRVKCTKCGQAGTVGAAENGAAAPVVAVAERVKVSCPGCAKLVQVKAELAGKAVKCPGCGKAVRVPQAQNPSPPALLRARETERGGPEAPGENEWLEVNEAVAPVAAPPDAAPPARKS